MKKELFVKKKVIDESDFELALVLSIAINLFFALVFAIAGMFYFVEFSYVAIGFLVGALNSYVVGFFEFKKRLEISYVEVDA